MVGGILFIREGLGQTLPLKIGFSWAPSRLHFASRTFTGSTLSARAVARGARVSTGQVRG